MILGGGCMASEEELKAEIEQLRAENQKLKVRKQVGLTLKVSEKKALSLYGLRRFPVTFYKEEWKKIIAEGKNILQFIEDHDEQLASK